MKNNILYFLLIAAFSCVAQNSSYEIKGVAANKNATIDNITVDLSESITVKSLSGFLHGLQQTDPSDDAIRALKPKLFRIRDTKYYDRAYRLAGRVHLVLSDMWFAIPGNWTPPKLRIPNSNWTDYVNFLNGVFEWGKTPALKPGIVWECWNEPDSSLFWGRNRKEYFETYKVFYESIRLNLGSNAIVAGPSIGKFDKRYLKKFFDYCLRNNLQINAVTWHELDGIRGDRRPFTVLMDHVQYIHDNFLNNPKYAPLKMQTIELNEIIGRYPVDQRVKDNPLISVSELGYLEKSNVDFACKSCWPPTDSKDTNYKVDSCSDNTLDGMFTRHNEKTPNWWAYKLYADGVPNRVKSFNENAKSIVLASNDASHHTANLLFGYTDDESSVTAPNKGDYKIRLNAISSLIPPSTTETKIYYKLYKIPYLGWDQKLSAPLMVVSGITYKDALDSINLTMNVTKGDLYQLIISDTDMAYY